MPGAIGPEVGRVIRRLREAKGLSGLALARLSGVTQGHLWALEAGKVANPGAAVLQALARALGVTVDELLHEPGEANG